MSPEAIPVAVIGAGNMGRNHIRVYQDLPDVVLVGVVEPDADQAATIEQEYDVQVVADVGALPTVQAASVVVPNKLHRQIATQCIERGLDILVEKPLAPTVSDAKAIVELATREGCLIQVGHIERFNPAVRKLREVLKNQNAVAFEAHRLGPFEEHLSEENVILDLMIHDIDVVQNLVGSSVTNVEAMGLKQYSSTYDYAVVLIEFENGVVANFVASHITHGKVRSLDVTAENARISIDYQRQDVDLHQRGVSEDTKLFNLSGMRTSTATVSPYVQTEEPLRKELAHFISCVRTGSEPDVTGREGVTAVENAARILSEME